MDIYVQKDGQQQGPFPESRIRQGIDAGEFVPTDLAWTTGKASWQPLSVLINLDVSQPPPLEKCMPPNFESDSITDQSSAPPKPDSDCAATSNSFASTPQQLASTTLPILPWQIRKPWLRVLRDIAVICLMTAGGGVISALIQNFVIHSDSLIPLLVCNVVAMTAGFYWIAASQPSPRFIHLLCVALGVWLISFMNVVFFDFSAMDWATGLPCWIVLALLIGWGIAKLLSSIRNSRSNAQQQKSKVTRSGSNAIQVCSAVGMSLFLLFRLWLQHENSEIYKRNANLHESRTNPSARSAYSPRFYPLPERPKKSDPILFDPIPGSDSDVPTNADKYSRDETSSPSRKNSGIGFDRADASPFGATISFGLRSRESELVAKYGPPMEKGVSELPPATLSERFLDKDVSYVVSFWRDAIHHVLVSRDDGAKLTEEDISKALSAFSNGKMWLPEPPENFDGQRGWDRSGASAWIVDAHSRGMKPDITENAMQITTDEFLQEYIQTNLGK